MKSAMDEITPLLSRLTPGELETVRQRIVALQSLGGATAGDRGASPADNDESMVLRTLVEVLSAIGVERTSEKMLRASSDMAAFRRKLPDLLKFIEQAGNDHLRRKALLGLCVELLYRDLVAQNIPVSARVVLRHLHRMPAVLNRHFPGYARSNLMGHIIRVEARKHLK